MKTKTISSSALQRRINRALSPQGHILRKCREGSRYHHERGDYYCVDIQTTGISETHIDLLDLARELQVIGNGVTLSGPSEDTVVAGTDGPVSEKEFLTMTRQMNRELRPMQSRINELIKKAKYGGLGAEEDAELDRLFKDVAKKAHDNVQKAVRMSGLFGT
jgi:hypothetical protein